MRGSGARHLPGRPRRWVSGPRPGCHPLFGAGLPGYRDAVDSGAGVPGRCVDVEVVIPLRWQDDGPAQLRRTAEMGEYLERLLSCTRTVTVVDGSPQRHARRHRSAWPDEIRMLRPEPSRRRSEGQGQASIDRVDRPVNGKVLGAMTGIRMARHDRVVLADDDVRLGAEELAALARRLDSSDLVKPVNVFDRWPWHAWWDGGRTLLNVAVAHDWPSVFALRRSAVLDAGGWSPEVLFENLELWRTMQAKGFRTTVAPDIVVRRVPPSPPDFWSQRVRQAYDDLAQPGRLVAELAILPALLTAARGRRGTVAFAAATTVAVAEVGRRRIGGGFVPPVVSLAAPVWLLERGFCVWLALAARARAACATAALVSARLRTRAAGWPPAPPRPVTSGGPDSVIARIAALRGPDGELLEPHVAAVELLNVLRPTVAVARLALGGEAARGPSRSPRGRIAGAARRLDGCQRLVRGLAEALASMPRRSGPGGRSPSAWPPQSPSCRRRGRQR